MANPPTTLNPNQPLTESNRRSSGESSPNDRNNFRNVDVSDQPAVSADSDLLGLFAEESSTREELALIDPVDQRVKTRFRRLNRAAALLRDEKIAKCSWQEIPQATHVVVSYSPSKKRSSFRNLQLCDKPLCPVCGFRRAEVVRHELSLALVQADKGVLPKLVKPIIRRKAKIFWQGWLRSEKKLWKRRERTYYYPVMITPTIRHNKSDSLVDLKNALAEAWDKTCSGSWYQRLCEEYLIVGKTKTWETTYGGSVEHETAAGEKVGGNGFHPHIHSLMFMQLELASNKINEFEAASIGQALGIADGLVKPTDRRKPLPQGYSAALNMPGSLEIFAEKLRERWIGELEKLGYDASRERGLDVRTARTDIAEYIAKFGREPVERTWGAPEEIGLSAVKTAGKDGMTPLEILAAAAGEADYMDHLSVITDVNEPGAIKKRAGALWRELYYAFKRTAMITWGKNLREALRLDEALEAYAEANTGEHDAIDMVMIEAGYDAQWWRVLRNPVMGPDGRQKRNSKGELVYQDRRAELSAVVRTGDAFKVMMWLSDHGIDGIVPPSAVEYSVALDDQEPARSDAGAGLQRRESGVTSIAQHVPAPLRRAHPGAPSPDHPTGEIHQSTGDLPP